MSRKEQLEIIYCKLLDSAVESEFVGIDPYDFASSGLSLPPFLLSKVSFINKVCPIDFRPILGISPSENSKSNALYLQAIANYDHTKYDSSVEYLKNWFEKNKSQEFEEFSVGFAFEMALTRYSSGPGKTSLIISLFTIFSFIDLYKKTGDLDLLEKIKSFESLLDHHWLKFESEDELWFSYLPDVKDEVYNATAKVGRFYAALYSIDQKPAYQVKIRKMLAYLARVQNQDGTWAYSTKVSYVDGFHTAFVLESVYEMKNVLTDSDAFSSMFTKGLDNYIKHMFVEGRPLHFHPQHKPKDVRSGILRTEIRDAANAIILFSKIGQIQLASAVLNWTIDNFYDQDNKYFYFYDNALLKSKINYIRWQGWMAVAISQYLIVTDANN